MSFNVKVKFFGRSAGSELVQSIAPDMTIRAVKEALAERVDDGVSPDRLKLIYLGRVMADDHTVGAYGVSDNQVLHMVVKPADTAEQPPRAQPSIEPSVADAQQPQEAENPFGDAAAASPGGMPAMGGLFQGLLQNLSAASPLMTAAITRAQQAAAAQQQQQQPGAPQPRSANRSPAPPAQDGTTAAPAADAAAAGAHAAGQHAAHHVFVNTMANQQPPPPSNVFHVHVHVTMDELRELPERLTAFNARMVRTAPNAQVHVQTTAGVTNARAAAAHAAAHPNPGQSRPAPPGDRPEAAAATTTLAEAQAAAGVPAAECLSMTKVLQEAVVKDAGMGEVMALAAGNWSCVEKTRAPLRALAMRRCNGNPTPALRAELVEEAVTDTIDKIDSNAEAQQQIRSRVRAGVNVNAFIRATARGAFRALLDLAIDGPQTPGVSYPQAFRIATVRHVGHALSFAERNLARNGSADVDAIVQVAVQMCVREALTARPDLAPVAGMAPMMILPTLRGWQEEYTRTMRRAADDGNLEMELRRTVACSTRVVQQAAPPASVPAAAAAAANDDDDDDDAMLDAALNEAGGGAPAAGSAESSSGLTAALAGLPSAARERIARHVAADAQAAVSPPPKHYFAGERHDALE